jgi:hypothetical protein
VTETEDAGPEDPPTPDPPDNDCPDGQKRCGDKCLPLGTDPLNCGACGHSCLGAKCVESVCEPVVLASGENLRDVLAMDDANVMFVKAVEENDAQEEIFRVPRTGGTPTKLTTTGKVRSMVLTKGRLIWSSAVTTTEDVVEHQIEMCQLPACTSKTVLVPNSHGGAEQILAVDADTTLYWVNGAASTKGRYAVESCKLDACGGTLALFAQGDPGDPGLTPPTPGLAVATTMVLWSTLGKLHACPKTGCPAGGNAVTAAVGTIGKVAAEGKDAYFWSFEGGKGSKVFTCPAAQCSPLKEIVAYSYGEIQKNDIAVDEKQVYLSLGDQLEVCPKAGCINRDPSPLVTSSLNADVTIISDATHVYIVHYGGVQQGAELVRAPK